jgi:hypothetical protein
MADDGPALLRPVPRRPFKLNVTNATPPEDEEDTYENELSPEDKAEFLRICAAHDSAAAASPISRNTSSMNLNSSTLYGIYADTDRGPDRLLTDGDTPWGADAQTPLRRSSTDDATYEIMRFRSGHRRGRSMDTAIHHSGPRPTAATALSLVVRGGVLFGLGVGYGIILLTRFRDSSQWPTVPFREGLVQTGYEWGTLILYGVAGVLLGIAMPWADGVWGDALGDEEDEDVDVTIVSDPNAVESPGHTTDGVLVMRAIGAFVGIVFAIVSLQCTRTRMVPAADNGPQRKLAWASTLQISLTLALVNPLLWWLIDRSKVGFLLSAAASLVGSIFLLGIKPDMMPAPPVHLTLLGGGGKDAASSVEFNESAGNFTEEVARFPLGGIASQETVEMGVWTLSVLFCTCLCFGNIGRRLAWDKAGGGRGRWAGAR